jgi:hypothetical protein
MPSFNLSTALPLAGFGAPIGGGGGGLLFEGIVPLAEDVPLFMDIVMLNFVFLLEDRHQINYYSTGISAIVLIGGNSFVNCKYKSPSQVSKSPNYHMSPKTILEHCTCQLCLLSLSDRNSMCGAR